jgi:hypothetical protein
MGLNHIWDREGCEGIVGNKKMIGRIPSLFDIY